MIVATLSAMSTQPLLFSTVAEVPASFRRICEPSKVLESSLSFSLSPDSWFGLPGLSLPETMLLELKISLPPSSPPGNSLLALESPKSGVWMPGMSLLGISLPGISLPGISAPGMLLPAGLSTEMGSLLWGTVLVPLSSEQAMRPKATDAAITGNFFNFITRSFFL